KHDIRRYIPGDVFRDISVRHTLKEISRQKKNLSDIARRDFKVFMKQFRRLRSDIVICVDASGSMGFRQKLIHARLVAAGLARAALEIGDKVGIVAFDNFGRTIAPITDRKKDVFNYLVAIRAGGNTNIGDGIKCATELLFHEPGRNQKYIVLITDGEPSALSRKAFDRLKPVKEKDLTEESAFLEASRASSRGVTTSVIHITGGDEAAQEFVKKIAGIGRGSVQKISTLEDLRAIM
ncbi:VWA domain-containing protein, partial [Thermodesulfobacteriota bacterium]